MNSKNDYAVKGDRPLGKGNKDKLGFRSVAQRIATSLIDRTSESGMVVGIEGAWGSGKSSLLYLIGEELEKLPEELRPTVINFQPWLIGGRDALIGSLFSEISKKIQSISIDLRGGGSSKIAKAKKAGKALRKFVNALSAAGAAIEVAGELSDLAMIKWGGLILKSVRGSFGEKEVPPQLAELKEKLADALLDLNHRFVVTIDDVDRLEPAEVIEVLRLVRSVIDLPNIIYLLCYDGEILEHSVEKAGGVKNGRSYLEKIIQLPVMVPAPEPFQLRQWFSDDLRLLAIAKDDEELARLKSVVDFEGGRQLMTPRSVVRALDAIRFFWPPLRDIGGDVADLVWIQLIKAGNQPLYRWIEEYCATMSLASLGVVNIDEIKKKSILTSLHKKVSEDYFDDLGYRVAFSEQLLGFDAEFSEGDKSFEIFNAVSKKELDEAVAKKRLTSPDHYRFYFAMNAPSHALSQDEYAAIFDALKNDSKKVGNELLCLQGKEASDSLTKADLLLERMNGSFIEKMQLVECRNLLGAFSNVLDEAYKIRSFELNWMNSLWDRAEKLVPLLLSRLDVDQRAPVINDVFSKGMAIGWLTSIFRSETFAHGLFGKRKKSPENRILKEDEFKNVVKIMIERYRNMTSDEIFSSPIPADIFFAWKQGGDDAGVKTFVDACISSNEGLIKLLENMLSTVNSSHNGVYKALRRDSVAFFMNYEEAMKRVENLLEDDDLGDRAKIIFNASID